MAANDIAMRWGSKTDLTITDLNSLADGNIWHSAEINDAGSPVERALRIWYELVFNATPVAGDSLKFYVLGGDEDANSEIWQGNFDPTAAQGEISTAATLAEIKAAAGVPDHVHAWQANHGTTFKGMFTVYDFPESWAVLIEADGEALAASGNRVAYQYGVPQTQ